MSKNCANMFQLQQCVEVVMCYAKTLQSRICAHNSRPRDAWANGLGLAGSWCWLHAALEGSVLVLKGKLSLHEFCCAFLDARQMAILQMQLALVCLGLSYSMTPVYHCSKHMAVSALICTALSLSMNYTWSITSYCKARSRAGLRQTSEWTGTIAAVQRPRNSFWQDWFLI